VRPARPVLWAAALRIASERPWLGLGPDNFRHVYGRYARIERPDPRVHANNMYLEVLAGAGVIGLLALLWLLGTAGHALWLRCRRAPLTRLMPAAAALAAWLMVAGHGLVDSFLSFTTTYLTFALAAGLAFSPGVAANLDGDAHRI
jgi:O-antigen ligase